MKSRHTLHDDLIKVEAKLLKTLEKLWRAKKLFNFSSMWNFQQLKFYDDKNFPLDFRRKPVESDDEYIELSSRGELLMHQ